MRLSIRHKLFIALSGLILFYVVLSWLLNGFLLNKYYIYNKENALLDSYKQLDSVYKGYPKDILLELEKLETSRGVQIIIFDENLVPKYVYNEKLGELRQKWGGWNKLMPSFNLYEMLGRLKAGKTTQENTVIETGKDDRLNSYFIRLFSSLNNGDYILMSTSVAAIEESAGIANKFFLITGLITILTGSFLLLFITGKFTKPILQLNNITRGMATLDFSKRYPVKGNDELGQLGSSINSLSEQLEKSIYELREANQKLKEDIERERKIDEMRKEFISSVSHELKTPIALIQGYAEGLKVNVNEDQENKNFYCDVIIDESLRMNRLVKQLLELSQLESGGIQLEKVDFDVSRLLEQVLRKNDILLREMNIKITLDKADGLMVYADYERVEQVFVNYLNNAVNHVNDEKIIRISVKGMGGKARVSVYNSGRHIPEESIQKIWTSFYKVDKARTRAYGGTGLGLSIVRAIQETYNNAYGVNNVEGGVEFWFELDLSEA